MKNIITSTLQRVINKTKWFSAEMVENHIQVKGPYQFLEVYVFIRTGYVVVEIENERHSHVVYYELDLSLQELVRLVLIDIDIMDRDFILEEDLEDFDYE